MSIEAVNSFRQQVRTDSTLATQIKSLEGEDQSLEKIVAIAGEAGFSFTADDLREHTQSELSDDQLEQVAGGSRVRPGGDDWRQPVIDLIFGQNSKWW